MAKDRLIKCLDSAEGDNWALYHGDCVDIVRQYEPNAFDLALYSPPFSNLYCYSDSERDLGNTADDAEFLEGYSYLVHELHRVMRPGRIVAVHCKDLVNYKGRDGMAGLRDFPGDIIRIHQEAGFAYHSRVTVWRCPVTEMQRTKAHGLLYKQLRSDSTFSRHGLAEYVLAFRKWSTEETEQDIVPVTHTHESFTLDQWQQWASPVWMDIDQTNVLNVAQSRGDRDSKHICPLQLDIIERCIKLWSNPGETVFSPFAGIGSEGHGALKYGRKFIGCELKDIYFEESKKTLRNAASQLSLFDRMAANG